MLMNKLDSQKTCALKERNDSYVIYDILKLHPCFFCRTLHLIVRKGKNNTMLYQANLFNQQSLIKNMNRT